MTKTARTLLLVAGALLARGGTTSGLPAPGSADSGANSLATPEQFVASPQHGASSLPHTADTPSDLLMDSPDRHPDLTVALTRQHAAAPLPLEQPLQMLQRSRRQAEEEADVFLEQQSGSLEDPQVGGQHFFPSFAPLFSAPPPLGHSRPQILFQEPSQRPSILRAQHNPFQPLEFGTNPFKAGSRFQPSSPVPSAAEAAAPATVNKGLLGSGNFGVIRGGTFYDESDRAEASEFGGGNVYNPYYNGHGRPSFYGGAPSNPKPQRTNDFFANFRDFADINAPTKSSFSEFYVVYVNKNASRHDAGAGDGGDALPVADAAKPNNIIEQLKMLDQENRSEDGILKKKASHKTISLGKQKLAHLQQDKYNKQQNGKAKATAATLAKDLYEPLLALS